MVKKVSVGKAVKGVKKAAKSVAPAKPSAKSVKAAVAKPRLGEPLKGAKNYGKYEWRTWCDGKEHRLVEGVNFVCQPNTFRLLAKSWAKRNGVSVTISIDSKVKPNVVTLKFN